MRKIILVLLLLTACTPGTRYTLHEANDVFVGFTDNEDRDFSQGVQFNAEIPDDTGSHTYGVGQIFFTPGDKRTTLPQPEDRPYAGYLYGSYDKNLRRTPFIQDTFGIQAGMVGPHSYSEQAQNETHRLLDQNTAKGWRNQIHDELGIILKAERNVAVPFTQNFDSKLTLGAHLGNVFTQAYTGYTFRAGYNLPDYFGYNTVIYPRVDRDVSTRPNWNGYFFLGPYLRAVARNIFLDGNTFRDSAHVDKKPLVAEGRAGLGGEYNGYRLAYTYVVSQSEYKGQPDGGDFGEITLGFDF